MLMGKDDETTPAVAGVVVEDVEEGEISDSTSVEEISEEDFVQQEAAKVVVDVEAATPPAPSIESSKSNGGDAARVWTVQDIYNYHGLRGYRNGLVNLAWAQAVQNKPFDQLFVMDGDQDEKSKRLAAAAADSWTNGMELDNKVVIVDSDDEMEEGELEEGEIDLDDDENPGAVAAAEAKKAILNGDDMNVDDNLKNEELEKRVNSIREALESFSVNEAEKSFGDVCLRLLNTLERLRGVLSETSVSIKEAPLLARLSFTAVQAISSVFCSMSPNRKEQNRDIISRLLSSAKNYPPLFAPEQIKEIAGVISSVDSLDVVLQAKAGGIKENETQVIFGVNNKDSDTSALNSSHVLPSSATLASDSVVSVNNPITLSEGLRAGMSSFRGRGVLLPLLDLHKDHDADSLPSPTRDSPSCFPVQNTLVVTDGIVKPGLDTARGAQNAQDSRLRSYETEALKAVSTYQQKFNRSSFFMSERLPSPTPSEDGDNGDDDTAGEVSSSSSASNSRTSCPPISGGQQIVPPPTIPAGSSSMQAWVTAKSAAPGSSGSNMTVKAPVRNRDPRLRLSNSDIGALNLNQQPSTVVHSAPKVDSVITVSSRKQKPLDESKFDGPALKRQRNGLENSGIVRDAKTPSASGGWLEDSSGVGPNNQTVENAETDPRKVVKAGSSPRTVDGPNSANEHVSLTGASMVSLPALLKDIAVNPTMLLNILKMGQQQRLAAEAQPRSADPAKSMTHPTISSSMLGSAASLSVPSKTSGNLQPPSGALPVSLQKASMDESGKVRMKPRDPRRALHGSGLQKSGSLGNEQFRNIVSPVSSSQGFKDNLNVQNQDGQADKKLLTSQSLDAPDIARQFTKNLKNIADIMSVSNGLTSPAIDSQSVSSQPLPIKPEKIELKAEEQRARSISASEAAAAGPSRSAPMWGDVEHLFEGYDDKQKAAIQRERARRIEEQKKMFAARKLCLVLDLDHTLLNSAKFVEVDPVHDEILRKKEEQDREKPQRHLFRFHHMGMWTKLRPGVWNFLEKASQLFELHLYTMGNKLYATEMAKVLDPTGALFAGRVISRGDDGDDDGAKSKDLEGVLGMESAVVIIDDSVRVWPHNKLNLIVVERYTYFPCSRRQFGLLGPSLLEIDHDERHEDGTLASSLAVIERIHQIFFSHPSLDEADVRNILASEQRKILGGCRIVFSRVFPVGEVKPHLHPLWQTAEQFGAVCTNHIDEQVTHVVANSLGTDKVNWALSSGKFVVHPGWVEASALLYRRANEHDFAIKP